MKCLLKIIAGFMLITNIVHGQDQRIKDYLDSDQHLVSVHLGKAGRFFSGQLMVGYQTSGSAIHYTYEDGDETYDVDLFLKNENNLIMEASAGLKLGPLFICSAISYSQHLSVSGGFGLAF